LILREVPQWRSSQEAVFFIYFFQIFALRAKIWKNKSLHTLLPQANLADEYAIMYVKGVTSDQTLTRP
jgi:hypothetical protein